MNVPITIRVLPDSIHVETNRGDSESIPIQNISHLRSDSIKWAKDIAEVSEQFGTKANLSDKERAEVLDALTEIGLRVTRSIFNGGLATLRRLIEQYPGKDMRVLDKDNVWLPWELLCFENSGELSPSRFCGCKRNIYRSPLSRGRSLDIASLPSVGFLAHRRIPFCLEEHGIVWRHLEAKRIAYGDWRSPRHRDELLAWLESLNVIHFASLMAPVQYLEKSFILVEPDFWISIDDFSSSRPAFSFTAAPLIFFNVRDNYARNPRHIVEYVKMLFEKGAVGVIASEFPIPPALSFEFVDKFYRLLFEERKSVDCALSLTKNYFLEECKNPFAMFYVPYLDPVVKAPEIDDRLTSQQIRSELLKDPIVGMEMLSSRVRDIPKLQHERSSLDLRLAMLHELQQYRKQRTELTADQKGEWKEAVYHALEVCSELEELERKGFVSNEL